MQPTRPSKVSTITILSLSFEFKTEILLGTFTGHEPFPIKCGSIEEISLSRVELVCNNRGEREKSKNITIADRYLPTTPCQRFEVYVTVLSDYYNTHCA